MALSSIQTYPTTPTALPARQLPPSSLSSQTINPFLSQLAEQINQSPGLRQALEPNAFTLQADGLAAHSQTPSDLTRTNLTPSAPATTSPASTSPAPGSPELREAFQDFVGQTFFAEMIKACRSGQQPSAYFNGGRAEEIFQGQLDQVLSEELSKSSADKIADPMFELFMLKRQS